MSSPEFFAALRDRVGAMIPHVAELGILVTAVSGDGVDATLPIQPHFIGDPDRNRIHTGIITTLIDSAAGVAVIARIGKPGPVATLDLRIDYLQPALADSALNCRAECYRLTTHIAFIRATVWQADREVPIANALATFVRGNRRPQGTAA